MKVVIIEDEKPAAEKLVKALRLVDPAIEIRTILTSLKESIKWFQSRHDFELIFMDIELGDGLSFDILKEVSITCPVIFTTAYDEYWQQAFERNSIEYLLKPVKEEKLKSALKKYEILKQHF